MKILVLNFSTHLNLSKNLTLLLNKNFIKSEVVELQFSHDLKDLPKVSNGDIVWINTTSRNLSFVDASYLENLWHNLNKTNCFVVQNNFELCKHSVGKQKIDELNSFIDLRKSDRFFVLDLNFISSMTGLENWYNESYWYAYKVPYDHKCQESVLKKLLNIILKKENRIKKCVVLDLDNTLWHGVIGDDGIEKIKLSRGDPIGESFNDFQIYIKGLIKKGALLAVCSKNEYENAKKGFEHPDSVLKFDDFVAFEANWKPKHINLVKISEQLNIGLDSFVFIDDNPAERDIVRVNLPEVSIPELGRDVTTFIDRIEEHEYFKTESVTKEDAKRVELYKDNFKRNLEKRKFKDHDDFLSSLNMRAEIGEFKQIYFERISQLSKRTNQFNLTTKRYNIEQIKAVTNSDKHLTLYGKLEDKFGDNGLVTAVIGEFKGHILSIDLWTMSCRVFNRDLEYAIFAELLKKCREHNIRKIIGTYKLTNKNNIVSNFYKLLGFSVVDQLKNGSIWEYNISGKYKKITQIKRVENEG